MKRAKASIRAVIVTALALSAAALTGCEESRSVGSGCTNGNCPQALSRNDDVCSVSVVNAEIAIDAPAGVERPLATVCLPSSLTRRDDGTIDARVYYFLTDEADPSIGCTDKPFLQPVSAAIRAEHAERYPDAEMCELNQLAVAEVDGGDPIVAAGDGFFYDDFTERAETECTKPNRMIHITDEATPWNGVNVYLTITETRDEAGEVDPALICEPIQGSAPVGTACLPTRTVFDDSEAVLETRVDACGDGLCMAYHLGGDVDPDCEEPDPQEGIGQTTTCATPEQIESRVYCTCRCDGPPGATDLCDCPDGFACVDVVPTLEPALAGRYCVRQNAVIAAADAGL